MISCKYKNLERAKAKALENGGMCLSDEYLHSHQKLLWRCGKDSHKDWYATFNHVVNIGTWCNECALEKTANITRLQNGLLKAQKYAESMGGLCLSTTYKNSRTKLIWKCSNDSHIPWESRYDIVMRGHWCPDCASKIGERRVRLIFERYFGLAFPTCRPEWNINPWTNRALELDGYCTEFNIAFEYNGQHHYKIDVFNVGLKKKDLIYQQFRDEQKNKNCIKQGVLLITIPIITNAMERKKFIPFLENIIQACSKQGLDMKFKKEQLELLEKDFKKL